MPHRIFLTQGHYPLKGTHFLFEGLPFILNKYPNTTVHIAGANILRGNSLKNRILRNGYGEYLAGIIHEKNLGNVVSFIGEQNADSIKKELLEANVFLSASAIENSPNSLCEAQMLGVPCVASSVGGTPDFIPNDYCGLLYKFQEPGELAERIITTFELAPEFDNTAMRSIAMARHDRRIIANKMISIYEDVAE